MNGLTMSPNLLKISGISGRFSGRCSRNHHMLVRRLCLFGVGKIIEMILVWRPSWIE